MTSVTNIRAVAPALPEIVGYVEAVTSDRLLGWAWGPAEPELRATIELRLGSLVIANTTADLPRPDLATNGIGDGRHAYDIAIPSEYRSRAAELRLFARVGNHEAVAIGAPPSADGLADQVGKLMRGVDMLVNSQRLIHRNLQAMMTASKNAGPGPGVETLSEMQAATAAQLATIERFVVRLDDHLAKLVRPEVSGQPPSATVPRMALWSLGLAGFALIVSVIGLVHSLGG